MPPGDHLELLGALVTRRHEAAIDVVDRESFDAAGFQQFLASHQLAGCVHALLADSPVRARLSTGLLDALAAAHRAQRVRNQTLVQELTRLCDRFRGAGLPFIVVKGPYLAHRFYGAVDRRRFWDLDVLVGAGDRVAAGRVLASAGYIRDSHVLLNERLSALFTHAFDYAGPAGRVDLHWALARHPSYRVDYQALWAAKQSYTIDGCGFDVLSDEHEIVFNLLSALRDIERGALRIRSLVDLYMMLDAGRASMDWTGFFSRREGENIGAICRALLTLCLGVFGCRAQFPALAAALGPEDDALMLDRAEVGALLAPTPLGWNARRWSWRLHGMSRPALLLWWAVSLPFRVTVYRTHRTRRAAPGVR